MTINQKLTKIQTEFKSKKARFNSFGKYYFRSAEDILEATKPFLKELDVTVTVDEELISFNPPVMQVTASVSDGKNDIKSRAVVGVDLDQKGMQMPQRYGAASSYGKKYALGNLFLIDDTQDPDHGKADPKPKVKIEVGTETFDKAKAYVKDQSTLDTILNKYDVDPKAIAELKKLI